MFLLCTPPFWWFRWNQQHWMKYIDTLHPNENETQNMMPMPNVWNDEIMNLITSNCKRNVYAVRYDWKQLFLTCVTGALLSYTHCMPSFSLCTHRCFHNDNEWKRSKVSFLIPRIEKYNGFVCSEISLYVWLELGSLSAFNHKHNVFIWKRIKMNIHVFNTEMRAWNLN